MYYLYLIQGETTKLIKIGVAGQPNERLKTLQAASPDILTLIRAQGFETYQEAYSEENRLHLILRRDRLHGEWFRPDRVLFFWGDTYSSADTIAEANLLKNIDSQSETCGASLHSQESV